MKIKEQNTSLLSLIDWCLTSSEQICYPEQFIYKRDKKILQYFKYRKIVQCMYTSKIVIQSRTQNCYFNSMLQFEFKCCLIVKFQYIKFQAYIYLKASVTIQNICCYRYRSAMWYIQYEAYWPCLLNLYGSASFRFSAYLNDNLCAEIWIYVNKH